MNRENQLLPWRITETLTDKEMRRVDQALQSDPGLSREQRQLSELRDHLQQDAVSPGDAAACLMATKAKIVRQAPQRTVRSRWWMAAGLAAGLMLSVGLWQKLGTDHNREGYETLTTTPDKSPGLDARVVFSGPLSDSELTMVLAEWNAEIVTDGTQSGVYTL